MNENILSFEISMKNILLIKVFATLNKLNYEREGFFLCKGSFMFE